MIKNEFAELRRRWKNEYNAVSTVYGYYINANKDIISTFDTSLGLMEPSEVEVYLNVLKKTISGTIGKNLIDIPFSMDQVSGSEEHELLMKLKDSQLKDEDARMALVEKIIPNVSFDEDNFLILMAADAYDLAYRDSNLEDMSEGGSEVYKYFICCVCPVKPSKLKLQYDNEDGSFHSTATGQVAATPELGFMFPAFDDRTTNIYNAVFYTKKPAFVYQEVIQQVFNLEKLPMSAPKQKDEFQSVVAETLEDECSFQVIRKLNESIRDKIENHKIEKIPENLEMTIGQIGDILTSSGASDDKVSAFTQECENRFGKFAVLQPANIIEPKKFNVETPEIKITVAPENSHLLRTGTIGGSRYILVPAGEGVEINGLHVSVDQLDEIDEIE